MFILIKGKGCKECPFLQIDYEYGLEECAFDNLLDDPEPIEANSKKKPDNCPFKQGCSIEFDIEHQE